MNKIRQLNNNTDITHTGKAKDYIPGSIEHYVPYKEYQLITEPVVIEKV